MIGFEVRRLKMFIQSRNCAHLCLAILLHIAPVCTKPLSGTQDRIAIDLRNSYTEAKKHGPRSFFSIVHLPGQISPPNPGLLDTLLSPFQNLLDVGENALTTSEQVAVNAGTPSKGLDTGNHHGHVGALVIHSKLRSGHGLVADYPYPIRKAFEALSKVVEGEKQNEKQNERGKGDFFSTIDKFPTWSGAGEALSINKGDQARVEGGRVRLTLRKEKRWPYVHSKDEIKNGKDIDFDIEGKAHQDLSQRNGKDAQAEEAFHLNNFTPEVDVPERQGVTVIKSEGQNRAPMPLHKAIVSAEIKQRGRSRQQENRPVAETLNRLSKEGNHKVSVSKGTSSTAPRQTQGTRTENKLLLDETAHEQSSSRKTGGETKIKSADIGSLRDRNGVTSSINLPPNTMEDYTTDADLDFTSEYDNRTRSNNDIKIPKMHQLTVSFVENNFRGEQGRNNTKQATILSEADQKTEPFEPFSSTGFLQKIVKVNDGNESQNTEDSHEQKDNMSQTMDDSKSASLSAQHKQRKRRTTDQVNPIILPSYNNVESNEKEEENKYVITGTYELGSIDKMSSSHDDERPSGHVILENVADVNRGLNEFFNTTSVEKKNIAEENSLSPHKETKTEVPNGKGSLDDGMDRNGINPEKTNLGKTDTLYGDDFGPDNTNLLNEINADFEIREGDEESEDYTDGVELLEFKRKRRSGETTSAFGKGKTGVRFRKQTRKKHKPRMNGEIGHSTKINKKPKSPNRGMSVNHVRGMQDKRQQKKLSGILLNNLQKRSPKSEEISQKKTMNRTSLLDNADVLLILKSKAHAQEAQSKENQLGRKNKVAALFGKLAQDYRLLQQTERNSKSQKGAGDATAGKRSRHVPNLNLPDILKNGHKKDVSTSTQTSRVGPLIQKVTPLGPHLHPSHMRHTHLHGGKPVDLVWQHHQKTNRHAAAILCFLSVALILVIILVLALTKATNGSGGLRRNDSSTALYVNNPHY